MTDRIHQGFTEQAHWCRQLGAPFTALLCDLFAEHLDRTSALGRRMAEWPAERSLAVDAVPLRLLGGLHALVRSGRLPELARLYPPTPTDHPQPLWTAIAGALAEAESELLPWLDGPPQTNEIGRSALLMSGLLTAVKAFPLPLALYEVGASAGLNLQLDRYAYRLGSLAAGEPGSPVTLAPAWDGAAPPEGEIRILRRRGADLNPLDTGREEHRNRLLGYIWPEQANRLARTEAALALAATAPPRIDRADAADWTERMLAPAPEPGTLRVLMHSIAFSYFPSETKRRLKAHLDLVGSAASAAAPLAWLRFEPDPEHGNLPSLRLRLWPDGTDRLLAFADPHVHSVRWRLD